MGTTTMTTTSTTTTTTISATTATTEPITTHTFTSDPNDNRKWTVSRKRPLIRNCAQNGNCPKPRRLILRKVRRKLYLNERERLQQRRKALNNNEYEASAVTNDVRAGGHGDSAEKKQDEWRVHNGNEDNIERNEQAYEEAIEKLRSLVREKKPEYDKLKDGRTKIVSKSVSFSTSTQ